MLRAIAVIAVVLFHFEVPGFSGGFVGVDIFFVISGYLITGQLRYRIYNNRFSYASFFARRARRLVPALAATLLLTAGFGLALQSPDTHGHLLKEIAASAGYVSNIFFWLESDYFDTEAITKPLLHTWSLSVEEQFYVVWPLLMLVFRRRRFIAWLTGVGLVSLIGCELMMRVDTSAAFFLFPFRMFEFALGALALEGVSAGNRRLSVLDGLALALVIGPIFWLDHQSWFPGIAVLPACVGTAWLLAAKPAWLNSQNPLIRLGGGIGRISYSAYLVHWPLAVFWTLEFGPISGWATIVFLCLTTGVLATFMWFFIEQPFQLSREPVMRFLPTVPAVFILALGWMWVAPTIYQTVHIQRVALDQLIVDLEDRRSMIDRLKPTLSSSDHGTRRITVVGDSHAADGALALKFGLEIPTHIRVIDSVCDPLTLDLTAEQLTTLYSTHGQPRATPELCGPYHQALLKRILKSKPDLILFSERWRADVLPYFGQTLKDLQAATSTPIVVLGPNQEFRDMPGRLLAMVDTSAQIPATAWQHRRLTTVTIEQSLEHIALAHDIPFISKIDLVCPTHGQCDYVVDRALTYWDVSHWSEAGLRVFGSRLASALNAAPISTLD